MERQLANLRIKAAVCAVYVNRCTGEFKPGEGEENAIRVANEAVKILNEWDERNWRQEMALPVAFEGINPF
jgi:hypothetical protein